MTALLPVLMPALRGGMLAALLLCAGGCDRGEPIPVNLLQLARDQAQYDGRQVETEGLLRSFPEPRHFWIEDEANNRVELVGGDNLDVLVGQRLAVRGRFRYAPDRGRRIEVESIEVKSIEVESSAVLRRQQPPR
jgi:hypothetical protein